MLPCSFESCAKCSTGVAAEGHPAIFGRLDDLNRFLGHS